MNDILLGLLLLLVGAGVAFMGLRVFFLLLPVWGFISGFFFGASLIDGWLGEGFLSTAGSWIAGLILGVLFALASYLYWYIGAIFAAGSVGALAGSTLMALLGVDSGWVILIVALVGAVLAALIALLLNLPVYIVIVNTALGGAFAVLTGILLLFNQINTADLGFGAAWATVQDSWLWLIAWAVIAGLGIATQIPQIAITRLPLTRWERAHARDVHTRAEASDAEQRY